MIFITVGTTMFPFTRLFAAIDKILIDLHSKETLIIQSPVPYSFNYPHTKTFTDLPFNKIISNYRKSRISLVHGGLGSIYLATKYCRNKPIIIPRYQKFNEHTNNNQVDYCQIIKHQTNTSIVFDTPKFSHQLQDKIQHPALIKNRSRQQTHQSTLITNLTKYTDNIFNQKNIVIVFNRLIVGGVEIKIVDIINKLFELHPQYHVTLILRDKNVSPIILSKINAPFTLISSPKAFGKISRNIIFPFFLSFHFLRLRPVAVLSFMDISSIASVIAKRISNIKSKLIISEDINIIKHLKTRPFPKFRKFLVSRFYPHASKIIALTNHNFDNLVKLGITPQKISVIPNWLPYATSNLSKTSTFTKEKKYDLLFIGRLDQQKNPMAFLKICKKMPNKKAVMIGTGPFLSHVIKKIDKSNIKNVTLVEKTDKIHQYYQQSKILVSTSRYEGCPPLIVLEAIVYGCLPIVPDISDINWYFDKFQNQLVYKNIDEAIQKINYLIKNNALSSDITKYYSKLILSERKNNLLSLINQITN